VNVYDAIFEAVAERLGVPVENVKAELLHRDFPDDGFWAMWDETVAEAADLYERVKS